MTDLNEVRPIEPISVEELQQGIQEWNDSHQVVIPNEDQIGDCTATMKINLKRFDLLRGITDPDLKFFAKLGLADPNHALGLLFSAIANEPHLVKEQANSNYISFRGPGLNVVAKEYERIAYLLHEKKILLITESEETE